MIIFERITSIVLSHFILNLRTAIEIGDEYTNRSSQQSSVRFVSMMEGNLGSTLMSGRNESVDDRDTYPPQDSHEPVYRSINGISGLSEENHLHVRVR